MFSQTMFNRLFFSRQIFDNEAKNYIGWLTSKSAKTKYLNRIGAANANWSLFGCYGTTDVFVEVNRNDDGHREDNLNLIDNYISYIYMNGAPLSVFNTLW